MEDLPSGVAGCNASLSDSPWAVRATGLTSNSLWSNEGLSGVCHNQLTAAVARRAAAAFAAALFTQCAGARPRVVLASDGRPIAAELFAAAAEAVRWAGCDVMELGVTWSSAVAATVRAHSATGGLYVGNWRTEAHTASLSFFGAGGSPWSLSGSLDQVRDLDEQGCPRPSRTSGRSERLTAPDSVPVDFSFALRQPPVRIVLDAGCPLMHDWITRGAAAHCQFISPAPLPPARPAAEKPGRANLLFRERREKMVARQVIADAADFGIWIDGNAESCTVIDDRGRIVEPQTLLALLARCPLDETDSDFTYIDDATRETLYRGAPGARSAIYGDAFGRIWHCQSDAAPQLDARFVLAGLIRLLCDSGQPLRKLLWRLEPSGCP